MPEYASLQSISQVTAAAVQSIQGLTDVDNPDQSWVQGTETTLNDALVAMRAPDKQVAVELYIDDGRGFLVSVPNSAIGVDVSIVESLDGWADVLKFSVIGERWSPLLSSALRGKRSVELYLMIGTPGHLFKPIIPTFRGNVVSVEFQAFPPVASVTCLDSSTLYSEQKVNLSIEANSKRSRLDIGMEALNQGGSVPLGYVDIGGDGGSVTKTVSTPPDSRKFDFLRDFWSPTGARLSFSGGRLSARRFTASPVVQRVVGRSDLEMTPAITPPSASEANVITAVAVSFTLDDSLPTRTETTTETVEKVYAPMVYVDIQNGGALLGVSGTPIPAAMRTVSRVVTSRTYRGSVLFLEQVDEYEWFSRQVAHQLLQDVGGVPTIVLEERPFEQAYLYPDGSYRKDAEERFQLVRRTVTSKDLGTGDLAKFIVRETQKRYFYHKLRMAVMQNGVVVPGAFVEGSDVFLDENGDGFFFGMEASTLAADIGSVVGMPPLTNLDHEDSSNTKEYDLEIDGTIKSMTETEQTWGPGAPKTKADPNAYQYGVDNSTYWAQAYETFDGSKILRKVKYTQIDETKYSAVETVTDARGNITRETSSSLGSRPRAESLDPTSESHELRSTVVDGTRRALSGEVKDEVHNEFCQTDAEVRTVALEELRERSAMLVTFPMPIENFIHKDMWIAVDYDEVGLDLAKPLLVWEVDRQISEFRQTLKCKYYPPEVAQA